MMNKNKHSRQPLTRFSILFDLLNFFKFLLLLFCLPLLYNLIIHFYIIQTLLISFMWPNLTLDGWSILIYFCPGIFHFCLICWISSLLTYFFHNKFVHYNITHILPCFTNYLVLSCIQNKTENSEVPIWTINSNCKLYYKELQQFLKC